MIKFGKKIKKYCFNLKNSLIYVSKLRKLKSIFDTIVQKIIRLKTEGEDKRMKKYIKMWLLLVSSILILSGCATKNANVPKPAKIQSKHPLYISFNEKKHDFNNEIQSNLPSPFGFRLDTLEPVNTPDYYKPDHYNSKTYNTIFYGIVKAKHYNEDEDEDEDPFFNFNCNKNAFAKEKTTDYYLWFNLGCGILTLGLAPIVYGFPHETTCVFDKEKYQQYIYKWVSKQKTMNRRKILSLYSTLYDLTKQNYDLKKQISKLLNVKIDDLKTNYIIDSNLNCNINSCDSILQGRIKKQELEKKDANYVLEALDAANKSSSLYVSKNILLLSKKIRSLEIKSILAKKAKLLAKIEKENELRKIKDGRKNRLEFIKNNYFHGKWKRIYWNKGRNRYGWLEGEGSYDKDGWPNGEGIFDLSNILKWDALSASTDIAGYTEVEVTIKNHKILSGKAISYVMHPGFFWHMYTEKYSKTFNGKDEMYKAAKETYDKAIHAYNNYVYKENHPNGGSVTINNCYDINNGQTMCKLYINGSQDGNIFYYYKDNGYVIYISGSSKAEANGGGYNPSLNYIYTANCGNSPLGSVNSISQALEMYANCSVNGHY